MQGLLLTELGLYDDTVERLSEFLESLPRSRAEAERGGEPEEENGQSREKQETPMEKLKRMRMLGEEDLTARFTVKQEVKKELELYDKLKEPPKKAPILKFWKENEATLPLLSKAARVTLGVPVAQASVERTFKTAVLTVTKQRASLNSSLVETMVIMKSNNGRVDFTGIEEEPAEYDSSDYTDSEEEEEEDVIENNNDDQNTEVESMETEIGVEEDMDEEPSTSSSFTLRGSAPTPRMPRKRGGRGGRGSRGVRGSKGCRGSRGSRGSRGVMESRDGGGETSGVSKGKSSTVRRGKSSAVRDGCSPGSSPERDAPSASAIQTNMDSDSESSLPDPDNQPRSTHNLYRYFSPINSSRQVVRIRRSSPDPSTSRPLISDSRDSAEEEIDENHNVPRGGPGQDAFEKMLGYEDDFSSDEDDMEVTLDH